MLVSCPKIEVAYHSHHLGSWCVDRKIHSHFPIMLNDMRSKVLIQSEVFAGFKQTDIEVCKSRIWFDMVWHGGKLSN